MPKKEYVKFTLAQRKARTNVYFVVSKSDNSILGRIYWECPWRQYVFHPAPKTIWSCGCLKQVIDFIQKLMDERKK